MSVNIPMVTTDFLPGFADRVISDCCLISVYGYKSLSEAQEALARQCHNNNMNAVVGIRFTSTSETFFNSAGNGYTNYTWSAYGTAIRVQAF